MCFIFLCVSGSCVAHVPGSHRSSLNHLSDRIHYWDMRFADSSRLVGQWGLGIWLSLSSPQWDCRHTPPYLVLVTAPSSCLCSRQLSSLHGNASCISLQCKCCLSPVWNKIRRECFLLLKTFPNCHLYLTTNGRKEKQKTMLCRKWCLLFPRFALWPLALLFLQDCPFS